jgi:peptidoglycan/LPS O-acetylase OafA/YrhL
MTAEFEKFQKVSFFGSLDGLRCLSIVGVIWFHSWWGTSHYETLHRLPVLREGEWGVQIFFVISGFLITTLLLRERRRTGGISIRDFYIRRSLRIWPLYYATVAVYVVIELTLERGTDRSRIFFHYLPGFLTYTYTWCITPQWPTSVFNLSWTLCTEEQFYAIWPLVLRFFRGIWSTAAIVGVMLLRVAAGYHWTDRFLPRESLPARVLLTVSIPICLGVLLAQGLDTKRGFRWLYAILGFRWSALAALVALAACLAPLHPPYLMASIATTYLVGACVIREDNTLAGILSLRPVAFLGVLSYGMYLLNSLSKSAVYAVLDRVGLGQPLIAFPLALAVAAAAAYLARRYIELPFLELKKRFSPSRRASMNSATSQRATA